MKLMFRVRDTFHHRDTETRRLHRDSTKFSALSRLLSTLCGEFSLIEVYNESPASSLCNLCVSVSLWFSFSGITQSYLFNAAII